MIHRTIYNTIITVHRIYYNISHTFARSWFREVKNKTTTETN